MPEVAWWCPGVMATCVQRGVQLRSEDDVADNDYRTEQVQEKASVEEISLPLLTKMSSERTLAVRAALMQQSDKLGTSGMDTLSECIWQWSVQQSRQNPPWNVSIIR